MSMSVTNESTLAMVILGAIAGLSVLIIVLYVFQLIAGWKVFVKMGEPGWKSLIPFYNGFVQYQHVWSGTMYWIYLACLVVSYWLNSMTANNGNVFLTLIAGVAMVASFVVSVMETHKLSRSFGHGVGFTIGLVLLRPIFYLILGFGSSVYLGNSSNYTDYNNYNY